MSKHLLAYCLIATILFASCQQLSRKRAVASNAKGFLECVANYDIAGAKNYATQETQEGTLQYIELVVLPMLTPEILDLSTPATIAIDSIDFTNDTTAQVYYSKTTPQGTSSNAIRMLKRNHKWLVDFVIATSSPSSDSSRTKEGN